MIFKVMKKRKATKIPPILHNGNFILDCKSKANPFNNFFAEQCKPIQNDSALPDFHYLTRNITNCSEDIYPQLEILIQINQMALT